MLKESVVNSVKAFYESLVEAGETFGSFGSGDWKAYSRSPVHPTAGAQTIPGHGTQLPAPSFGNYAPNPYAAPVDPRIPLGLHNSYSPVHQVVRYPMAAPGSVSPRDPRFVQTMAMHPVYHPQSLVAPMPFSAYGHVSPPNRMYSHVPVHTTSKPSHSQPARRRRSASSSSSDSDAAAEISAKILGSSDDPRELKNIMKQARRKGKRGGKNVDRSPQIPTQDRSRTRRSNSILDDLMGSVPSFEFRESSRRNMRRSSASPLRTMYDDDIPAANETEYFNDRFDDSPERQRARNRLDTPDYEPPRRERKEQRRRERRSRSEAVIGSKRREKKRPSNNSRRKPTRTSLSEEDRGHRSRPQLSTTVSSYTALVPVNESKRRTHAINIHRVTEKEKVGEKEQQFWNPSSVVTGKRQRLPPLDWRKGEKYVRAPDGTIIGKTGYSNIVCDDTLGMEGKKKHTSGDRRRQYVEETRAMPKKQRRESVPSTREERIDELEIAVNDAFPIVPVVEEERPLLNAFDYLQKKENGIYCLGKHPVLHRAADRSWDPLVEEGGFRLCQSITTKDAYIAEIALEPGFTEAREPETLVASQVIYGRILQAAANSVRLQITGKSDERLSEEDEFYIDSGSTYLITNLSAEKTAVLSLIAFE